MDAHIVPGRVGEEEALAPVASIGTRVLHGCTFGHAGVIGDPEQEDDLKPEDPVRIGDILGVVYNPEPLRLPPQALVHEDRHERTHTRWIPERWMSLVNSAVHSVLNK